MVVADPVALATGDKEERSSGGDGGRWRRQRERRRRAATVGAKEQMGGDRGWGHRRASPTSEVTPEEWCGGGARGVGG